MGMVRRRNVGKLTIGTWNVEGLGKYDELGNIKLAEIQNHMRELGVHIMCLQETHGSGSHAFTTPEGYCLVLSGHEGDEQAGAVYTGVGFLIAPEVKHSIIGHLQYSDRIAALKIKVDGGSLAVVTAYAPPGTKPHDERQNFYTELGDFVTRLSTHGPKIVVGDFNARLHMRFQGEEECIGEGVFGRCGAAPEEGTNRELFMELCSRLKFFAVNTRERLAPEYLATYRCEAGPSHVTL